MKFIVRLVLSGLLWGGSFAAADVWDTWVARGGLVRALPTYDEVWLLKSNRSIGMFYFQCMDRVAAYDIAQILCSAPPVSLAFAAGDQWRVTLPVATNGSRFFRLQAP